jgi:hypothetical protein
VRERRRRSGQQLLDDIKETRGYWKVKEKVLDHRVSGELALEEAML